MTTAVRRVAGPTAVVGPAAVVRRVVAAGPAAGRRAIAAGRAVALPLAAAGLLLAAGMLASLALFVIASGLVAAMAATGVVVAVARRRVRVVRSVAGREVREDEPLRLRYEVHGLGLLPVRLLAADRDGHWVPLDDVVELDVGRRGGYRLAPSELRLCDALGIFRRKILAGPPETVLILPVPSAGAHFPSGHGLRADDAEPDGLRPYVPGTPISRIHWPSLARGAELHELRQTPPPSALPVVVVDTAGADDEAALDWLARAAAGQVLRLITSGGCEVLLPGDTTATLVQDLRQWQALHRRLALLSPGPRPPAAPGAAVIRVPAGLTLPAYVPPLPTWVTPAPPNAFTPPPNPPAGALP